MAQLINENMTPGDIPKDQDKDTEEIEIQS
jgi:hypothetical protein